MTKYEKEKVTSCKKTHLRLLIVSGVFSNNFISFKDFIETFTGNERSGISVIRISQQI